MRTTKYMLSLLLLLIGTIDLKAQSGTHWQCDDYAFEYDMTVYYKLKDITNLSDYEVAAFCGDECRGVGEVQTVEVDGGGSVTYGYIRVRSNQATGETITFKVYDKAASVEKDITATPISFESNGRMGYPSAPVVFDIVNSFIPGDADGDGFVDLTDAQAIFEYYMGETPANFNAAAADFDGDGTIDLTDAQLVFEYYMNQ